MFLGTIYSIPPLRLKKRPFWAALSIALARGVVANGGLMLYFSQALAPKETLSTQTLLFIVAFFFLFGIVIALYKDIPDWSGDRQFQINTYAVTFGEKKVFQFGRVLLTGMYLLPIAAGLLLLPRVSGLGLALMHAGALIAFWIKSQKINPEKSASMMSLYLFLWGLFYTEYIFFAIYRLLAAYTN
jgi:homogentisate phytyltransferase/homogentisate geranylgeranyltransferase